MVFESEWVWIILLPRRLEFCRTVAREIYDNAIRLGRRPKNGAPTDVARALAITEQGYYGEAAGMIYLSPIKWWIERLLDVRGVPDLGAIIDVKTRRAAWQDLPVQRDDEPHWIYVLAHVAELPRVCLVGWCYGHEAKQDRFWGDPAGGRPAYWVPKDDPILRPMTALRRELERDPSLRGACYPVRPARSL